MHDAKIKIIYP